MFLIISKLKISQFFKIISLKGRYKHGLQIALLIVIIGFSFSSIPSGLVPSENPLPIHAGRNVNMVPYDIHGVKGVKDFERQNEPSIAVSSTNPRFLVAGANDYSKVSWQDPGVTGDAWLGLYWSYDGGESWTSDLLPESIDGQSPLVGYDAAADPTIRAGVNGWFYYSGIAFDRQENGDSCVFVARLRDPGVYDQAYSTVTVNDIVDNIRIVDLGTSGQFSDKPWSVADVPRPGKPFGVIYCVYSIFLGQEENNLHSKIHLVRSYDGGETWEQPVKVSESNQKNQGTTIAIDPATGDIYIAWRRFPSTNESDAMMITRSTNFGKTFTKAVEIATIDFPFDQITAPNLAETTVSRFRSNVYPTMAVDHGGRVYVAWAQRMSDSGYAKIVITSQEGDNIQDPWPPAMAVEPDAYILDENEIPYTLEYHQVMPSLTYGSGHLLLAWYDNRYSARVVDEYGIYRNLANPNDPDPDDYPNEIAFLTPWIQDDGTSIYRETIDVRAAQALPAQGDYPNFQESIQVSRYIWMLDDINDDGSELVPRQVQFNPPNYELFSDRSVPFHGDYLDITPSPLFIKQGTGWRFSNLGDPFAFHVSWTDNRDVTPLNVPQAAVLSDTVCADRNQNVYVSRITSGIEVGALSGYKEPADDLSFVIFINNQTGYALNLDLNLIVPGSSVPGPFVADLDASFTPFIEGTVQDTDHEIAVPGYSSIARMVFFKDGMGNHTTEVRIGDPSFGFVDSVYLYAIEGGITTVGSNIPTIAGTTVVDWSDPAYAVNGDLANPNILSPNILSPNILSPNILSPNILSPNILSPNILSPNILSPNILSPNILSPNILSPNILSPNILSTSVLNPNILSAPPGYELESVSEKMWKVRNDTQEETSYTFKSIAGDSLPDGIILSQLLIFKIHTMLGGCNDLFNQQELLVNIANPYIESDIKNKDLETFAGEPFEELFKNAAFSLGPEEEAIITLKFVGGSPKSLNAESVSDKLVRIQSHADYAKNLGAAVVSHASTADDPHFALSVQILPDDLVSGMVGMPYTGIIRAIGGEKLNDVYNYDWEISLFGPLGQITPTETITETLFGQNNTFSFNPITPGSYTLQVRATDVNNSQDPKDFDTHTFHFFITVAPLTLTMTPDAESLGDGPHGLAGDPLTTEISFQASGGIPPYHFELSRILQTQDDDRGNIGLTLTGADPDRDLSGIPEYAGFFTFKVTLSDESGQQVIGDEFLLNIVPKPLWAKRDPNVPEGAVATAMAIDDTGNVYVTGYAPGTSGDDYFTVMYASEANDPGWFQTYDGPGHGMDRASAIVLGSSGIYITGSSEGTTSGPDICTVKYSFGGTQLRVDRYDGPSHLGDGGNALAIAPDGSVYVTGYIHRGVQTKHADYCTLKYDGELDLIWAETYDSTRNGNDVATAIAIHESSGNVYITGKSQEAKNKVKTTHDFFTVVYDSEGDIVWEARDDAEIAGDDEPLAIVLDILGNAYVTGYRTNTNGETDSYTAGYSAADGTRNWFHVYNAALDDRGADIAVSQDSIFVTGKTGTDYFTIKYYPDPQASPANQYEWIQTYNNETANGDDGAAALAVNAGVVYVTGASMGAGTSYDFYTAQYTETDATLIWEARFDHLEQPDRAFDLKVFKGLYIYVAGDDFRVVKYDR